MRLSFDSSVFEQEVLLALGDWKEATNVREKGEDGHGFSSATDYYLI